MKKQIVLITGNKNFFGQTRKAWVSINTDILKQELIHFGFNIQQYSHYEIFNSNLDIRDSYIFYSFSQKENLRNYLLDIIYYLDNGSNIIIPSYDLLKCHENKGYQELFTRKVGLATLDAYYFSSLDDLDNYKLQFPTVLKTTSGSNAKGVFLIQNKDELAKQVSSLSPLKATTKFDLFRRKYLRKKKHYKEYPEYSNRKDLEQYTKYIKPEVNFILQQFIPNLSYDYRILILHDKYFVVKRNAKKGDFKASGTKRFEFMNTIDKKLLNYANSIRKKINTPFLSLDIIPNGEGYSLIEFQALHFGIAAFQQNETYFALEKDNWVLYKKEKTFELEMATAITRFIESIS
jgi:glutathione synthase/RimK-type ligase-like ATP-grasp enzyme